MSAMAKEVATTWRKVRLPAVAEINPRRFTEPAEDASLVSFVPMKAVEEESGRLSAAETKSWANVKKGYTPFQDGDVIFAKITPCMENGKYAVARGLHGGRAAGSTEFHVFRPSPELDPQFLLFFLFSPEVRRAAKMNMRGAAGQLRVPPIFFEDLELPVPPLDDQRRIVAEIEKQFTRLEAGVAGLRRVQANLKRYRAAVLKAACEGKLVPTEAEIARKERRSYETGEQLLERILTERRARWTGRGKYKEPTNPDTANLPPLPEGWTWASVEQLSNKVQYGYTASAVDRESGVRFLRITDIQDGRVEWSSVPSCEIPSSEIGDLRLLPGDIVFARTGATVGKSFQLKAPFPEAIFASYLIRISPAGAFLSNWLYAFFQSPAYWAQIRESAAGIGQPNVNGTKLQALWVPLPPLAEQERIVAEVERRLSVVEELEAVVSANLQRGTRLRQAILQRAFEGELVRTEQGETWSSSDDLPIAAESPSTYRRSSERESKKA